MGINFKDPFRRDRPGQSSTSAQVMEDNASDISGKVNDGPFKASPVEETTVLDPSLNPGTLNAEEGEFSSITLFACWGLSQR